MPGIHPRRTSTRRQSPTDLVPRARRLHRNHDRGGRARRSRLRGALRGHPPQRTGTNRAAARPAPRVGEAIHPRGSDHRAGAELLRPGRRIGSRESAIAATCGHTSLQVAKLPALTIVSTGDELVEVAAQPAAHQIRRSNDFAIETALARTQLYAAQRVALPDHRDQSAEALSQLIDSNDFLILTGGISKGTKDFIPEVLDALGLCKQLHGVAQKPGKPFGYWSRPDCGVFALPGNPLSVLVSLHRYVLPALLQSLGAEPGNPQLLQLDADAPAHPRLTYFLPARIDPTGRATAQPANNSGDFVSILQTDGFIELVGASPPWHPRKGSPGFFPGFA